MTPFPTVVAIIQARMSSSRLPGKVLAELGGRPVLDHVICAAQAAPGVARVAVATSEHPSDDPVSAFCKERGLTVHRGPLDDVLARYGAAVTAEGLRDSDAIVRLTGDCPILDPSVIGMVVERFSVGDAALVTNVDPPSWPDGLDCELIRVDALRAAVREANRPRDREHVVPFVRRNQARFPVANIRCPAGHYSAHRWTLDTAVDLAFLRRIVERLPDPERRSFAAVMAILRADPSLLAESVRPHDLHHHDATKNHQPWTTQGSFSESNSRLARARRVIPLGSQTFSKSHLQYPKDRTPLFVTHGSGGRVCDVDGNEFVDLVAGLLPVVLGYRDPAVDEAVRRQLDRGISLSMSSDLEADLAERLKRLVPCAEMVRFGKNGSDATTAAIRLARAATGRERVAVCGYHGWHDWYIGSTTRDKGVPRSVKALTDKFPYNDLASLETLIAAHPKQHAAVILEVMNATDPAPGYLEGLRSLCTREGIILIFDEIITGFRFALGGAQELFGVTPDLACFGKAMANGMPLSAVVGRADLMMEMEEIFFSGTFGGEALSLAASIATIDKLEREGGIARLWRTGEEIATGVNALIALHGLTDVATLNGRAPWKLLALKPHPRARAEAIKTKFLLEMIGRGVLMGSGHNVMVAHTQADVAQILWAYDGALEAIAAALQSNGLEESLPCPVVQPVFKVR